jgi:integrase
MTRDEKGHGETAKARRRHHGQTPKHTPVRPAILLAILTGMRRGELLGLRWRDVDLREGHLRVSPSASKSRRARLVMLDVCPSLTVLLDQLGRDADPDAAVCGHTRDSLVKAARRVDRLSAPAWTWQRLRQTCATYLCAMAPPIGGPWYSARRLGHSVVVAERHYAGLVRVPVSATTLEQAMELDWTGGGA